MPAPLSERNNSSRLSAMTSATGTSALEQLQQRLRDLQQQRQSLKNPEVAAKPRPASAQQISAKRVVPPGKPKTPGVLMPMTSGFTGSPIHHALPPSGMNAPASDSKLLSARPSTQGGARPSSKLGPRGSFGPACGTVPPLFAISSTPRLDIRPDSSGPLSTDRERTALVHRQRKLIREGYTRHGLPVPTITEATSLEPLLYRSEKVVGKGAFGLVSLARSIVTGELVAMKTIDRAKLHSENLKKAVEHEIRILKKIKHQSVVKLYEVFETPRSIHIIMEYVDGGTVQQLVKKNKRIAEEDAAMLFAQLVDAVSHCHEHHVCHRDLKLENFMLGRNGRTLKLIDFGLSVVWKPGQSLFKSYGTPCYMAPEIIKGANYSGSHVDVWSLGVALATMLTGSLPFQGAGDTELKKHILRGTFPCPEHVTAEARDLLARMLALNPAERISMEAIKQHPWLRGAADAAARSGATCPAPLVAAEVAPLDEGILAQLEQLGLERGEVERSVRSRAYNHSSACYEMLLTASQADKDRPSARGESSAR